MDPLQQNHNKPIYIKYLIQQTNELIDHESRQPSQRFRPQYIQPYTLIQYKPSLPIIINKFRQHNTEKNIKGKQSCLKKSQLREFDQSRNLLVEPVIVQSQKRQKKTKVWKKKQNLSINQDIHDTGKEMKQQQQQQQGKSGLNRKGLALISSLILEVLERQYKSNKKFTCGQISLNVLKEYCNKYHQDWNRTSIQDKEMKTIKRRVYDSINVLIALGRIKKDKKYLYLQSIDNKIGAQMIDLKQKQLNLLEDQWNKKQKMNDKYRSYYNKLIALKQRNESIIQYKEEAQSRSFSTFQPSSIYKFPLLFLYTQKGSNINITVEKSIQDKEKGDLDQQKETEREIMIFDSTDGGVNLISDLDGLANLKSLEEFQRKRQF